MIKILVRIFPVNRRGSFASREIVIYKTDPVVKDIFEICTEIDKNSKIARGITYLALDDKIMDGEQLNVIPI